jgi:hypothetical protein
VRPPTLVRWHRQGFGCSGVGSHGVVAVRGFLCSFSASSPTWRAPIRPGARNGSPPNCC